MFYLSILGGAFLVQSLMFSSKYYFEFNAKPCCAIISVMFSLFIIISNIVIFEPGLSRLPMGQFVKVLLAQSSIP